MLFQKTHNKTISGAIFFTALTIVPVYLALFYIEPMLSDESAESGKEWLSDLYVGLLQLAELPATANVSINFLMYLLGSKVFRKEFKGMLKKVFRMGGETEVTGGQSQMETELH